MFHVEHFYTRRPAAPEGRVVSMDRDMERTIRRRRRTIRIAQRHLLLNAYLKSPPIPRTLCYCLLVLG